MNKIKKRFPNKEGKPYTHKKRETLNANIHKNGKIMTKSKGQLII